MNTQNPGMRSLEAEPRFEFGKNWRRFLLLLSQERIAAAELSLRNMLGVESLEGKTFLDVGSGSGLFSLAARRLGASVVSFDYDPDSVACAVHLQRTFFSADREWRIERGSALDREYLGRLGKFDVVYSWGVLHHTGAMWDALENMPQLVKPGGTLWIALYNDQGKISGIWRWIKRAYNGTPPALRFVVLWPVGFFLLARMTMADILRLRKPRILSKSSSPRGMSVGRDIVDWVGGYPFEVSTPEKIVDFYQQRGFQLDRSSYCGRKLGCNEFVFTKLQELPREPGCKDEPQELNGKSPRH